MDRRPTVLLLSGATALAWSELALAETGGPGADGHAVEGHAEAAHEEGGHGRTFGQAVFYQAINFAIVAAILFFAARKGVKSFFFNRSEQIRGALEAAKRAQREAEERSKAVQDRLARLDADIQEILGDARRVAEAEKKTLLDKAHAAAAQIRADAERQIVREVEEVRAEVARTLTLECLAQAGALITKEMQAPDRSRLFDESLGHVASLPKA